MKYIFTLFPLLAIIFLISNCKSNAGNPSSCMENPDSNSTLLVIVGEKISIREEQQPPDSSLSIHYGKFTAHYRILEKVCGDYQQDTISFTAYDHYGFPSFGNYQHVLLYLNITQEGVFHEIYLYSPLYKTKDDRWASPYSTIDYKRGATTVKPEKIDFVQEVSYSIEGLTRAKTKNWFPEPYYKIDKLGKKAIAVWGNYAPDLFQIQKETVLKARGIYGKPDSLISKPRELIIAEYLNLSKKDSLELLNTWNSFVKAVKSNDTSFIKNIALDSIVCSVCEGMPREHYENNLESIDMFIDSAFTNLQKSGLWPLMEKNKYKINITKWPEKMFGYDSLIVFDIAIPKLFKTSYATYRQYHYFEFIKINNFFRFYKMESY